MSSAAVTEEEAAADEEEEEEEEEFDPMLFLQTLPPLSSMASPHRALLLPPQTRSCQRKVRACVYAISRGWISNGQWMRDKFNRSTSDHGTVIAELADRQV